MDNHFATVGELQAAAGRRRYGSTSLPISGLRVRFQSWMESELAEYDTETVTESGRGTKKERLEDATRRMIVQSLVDAAGNRLYTDEDAAKLRDWDSADTQHLYDRIRRFIGLDRDHIASLVKNSEPAPAADTQSGSQTD